MKKIITSILLVASLFTFANAGYAQQLDEKTQQALIEAIQDEYKARALYQKVINKFGDVRPFSNIIKAETQHVAELKPLFEKYGVEVPKDEWSDKVPEFESLQEACEASVKAEIENAGMYDEFFKFVEEQDILDVFKDLRNASQDKHLPAFQRCADNSQGKGRSQGQGQGRNRNQEETEKSGHN